MEKSRSLFMIGVTTALLFGCQSTPFEQPPFEDQELRSELREEEKKRIYEEYMMQQAMARQRQEVAINQQRERQRRRESGN